MGAVISMDGMRANRKQIFDIGIAGPLAGLAVAVPILYIGVKNLNLTLPVGPGDMQLYNPVIGALDDPMGPSGMGRSGGLGFRFAAQSIFHGRLGRHVDHGT